MKRMTITGEIVDFTPEEVSLREAEIAEYESRVYAEKRASAYYPLPVQLDMQYWDSVNGTTTWRDHVASVKAQFPKP